MIESQFLKLTSNSLDGHIRVNENHPIDLYVGYSDGRKQLLLRSSDEPCEFPKFRCLSTERRKNDKFWFSTITLDDDLFETLFFRLADDLINITSECKSGVLGAKVIANRLRMWQKAFAQGTTGHLSHEALRGLLGEVLYLEKIASSKYGLEHAIRAWRGPRGAIKDFVFPKADSEVKTVFRNARSFIVSSLAQLASERPLLLALVTLEDTSKDDELGQSATAIIDRVKDAALNVSPELANEFDELVLGAGFIRNRLYDDVHFRLEQIDVFDVCDGFPRITPVGLSPHITDCSYNVSISGISNFLLETWVNHANGS